MAAVESGEGVLKPATFITLARIAMVLCLALPAWPQKNSNDLAERSLEDLMNIEVTSVAKTEHPMVESAAAVFVITQDDIRRSGMTSVPEILRLVPGLSVAQVDGNMWAISSRGFNGQFANKLLVLIDGRSVYTPLYSGVYWEVQDLMLEDIDRIEVIRGPGAALWGANAVNGVINIITKRAQDTQGGLLSTGISTAEQRFANLRYGSNWQDKAFFRVFAKYSKRDGLAHPNGERSPDGMDVSRGGFRSDFQFTKADSLTFQGDAYSLAGGQHVTLFAANPLIYSANDSVGASGGDLLSRWNHVSSDRSDFSLQSYFDVARVQDVVIGARINSFDLAFENHRLWKERHEVVWGLGFRQVRDRVRGSFWIDLEPSQETTNVFSGFVQDEIKFLHGRARLTLGSKFEHNDFTGVEIQPNVRFWFKLHPQHHLWLAVSRSVRTPSRAERDIRANLGSSLMPDGTIVVAGMIGNPQLISEKLLAYQAGYRWQATSRLSLDVATYYNQYRDLTEGTLGSPVLEMNPPPPHLLLPLHFGNDSQADGYGTEVAANLKLTNFLELSAGETWGKLIYQNSPGTAFMDQLRGSTPVEQFNVRSEFSLGHNLHANVGTYFVGGLPDQQITSYTRLDVSLGWDPWERVGFTLGAENLLQDQHPEFRYVYAVTPTEVRRNVFAKVVWRF